MTKHGPLSLVTDILNCYGTRSYGPCPENDLQSVTGSTPGAKKAILCPRSSHIDHNTDGILNSDGVQGKPR